MIRPRDLMRLVTILFMAVFVLWAINKSADPLTWNWIFAFDQTDEPDAQVSLDPIPKDSHTRRSPTPDPNVLTGAWDRQRFLVDDPKDLEPHGNWRDANARYHLIQLAAAAKADALALDARTVSYSDLMKSPEKHRGRVVEIEGDLRRVSRFAMKRSVPGVNDFYQGWITGSRDETYCVLFAETPGDFPPETDWNWHVTRVRFAGYFLKVLKADDSGDAGRSVFVPALVGKMPEPIVMPQSNILSIAGIIVAVLLGTVLLCGLGIWLYRRGDRRLAEKVAQLRQIHHGRDDLPDDPEPSANSDPQMPIFVNED